MIDNGWMDNIYFYWHLHSGVNSIIFQCFNIEDIVINGVALDCNLLRGVFNLKHNTLKISQKIEECKP